MNEKDKLFMKRAIELAQMGVESNSGGPFGAVVVKGDEIIAEGYNRVTSSNDPTAHAEIVAIRKACEFLNSYQLEGCIIYTSCEPCPMCLGAIYWARPKKVFYACKKEDAALINFDDQFIYSELEIPLENRKMEFVNLMREEAIKVFDFWEKKTDKKEY